MLDIAAALKLIIALSDEFTDFICKIINFCYVQYYAQEWKLL